MKFKSLIVDDEPLARQRLRYLLQDFKDDIEIKGEAAHGNEALDMLTKEHYDLIFLDIQMPGMTGLELLGKLTHPPMIIFTTAFDQYAVKAFEENAVDYLLKPVERERLKKTIEKIKRIHQQERYPVQSQLKSLLEFLNKPKPKHFPVKVGDSVIFIDYEDIFYFKADDKLVTVNTYDKAYICSDTLTLLEKKIPAEVFLRCHRSAIVNVNKIREVRRWFAGKFKIIMNDKKKSELPLSRNLKSHFGF